MPEIRYILAGDTMRLDGLDADDVRQRTMDEDEAHDMLDQSIDEFSGQVTILGTKIDASAIAKEMTPVDYRIAFSDMFDEVCMADYPESVED